MKTPIKPRHSYCHQALAALLLATTIAASGCDTTEFESVEQGADSSEPALEPRNNEEPSPHPGPEDMVALHVPDESTLYVLEGHQEEAFAALGTIVEQVIVTDIPTLLGMPKVMCQTPTATVYKNADCAFPPDAVCWVNPCQNSLATGDSASSWECDPMRCMRGTGYCVEQNIVVGHTLHYSLSDCSGPLTNDIPTFAMGCGLY